MSLRVTLTVEVEETAIVLAVAFILAEQLLRIFWWPRATRLQFLQCLKKKLQNGMHHISQQLCGSRCLLVLETV
jgi:hypothetical protein